VVKSIKAIGWQCGCSTQEEVANAVSRRSLEKLADLASLALCEIAENARQQSDSHIRALEK
jgi:hypothetical protein